MGYLPSKNFIAIVSSAIVVVFAGYFSSFVWKIGRAPKIIVQNTVQSDQKPADNVSEDTDGDGLKNWEEVLWKTNINKTDTDDDGMPDAEEIAEGRDPVIKRELLASGAWSDALKKPEEIMSDGPGKLNTLTENLAMEFANGYFSTKQAAGGQSLNTSTKSSIANALSLSVEQGVASYADIYSKKDVKISESADPKKYLNRLGAALDENFKNIDGMEVQIAAVSAQTGQYEELAKLDPYLEAYKKTVGFLVKESVPPSYADLHLMILNSMNNTGLAVENLKLIKADPFRSLIGVQLYYREIARARQFFGSLKTQTEKDKITFGLADTGSFFNQYFDMI